MWLHNLFFPYKQCKKQIGKSEYEGKNQIFTKQDQGRKTAGDVAADGLDLSLCQAVLAGHGILYFVRDVRHGGIVVDQYGLQKSGGYYHRT